MEFIEVSAKTVSDCITEACQKLGVTSDKLEYEVLEEGSSGFLGFNAKPAVINARVKEEEVKADDIKDAYGWTKISTYELAAEIYSHAYAYYNAGALLAIAGKLGIDKAASYLTSLKKIDVENGRDSRYWAAFDVIYATL